MVARPTPPVFTVFAHAGFVGILRADRGSYKRRVVGRKKVFVEHLRWACCLEMAGGVNESREKIKLRESQTVAASQIPRVQGVVYYTFPSSRKIMHTCRRRRTTLESDEELRTTGAKAYLYVHAL